MGFISDNILYRFIPKLCFFSNIKLIIILVVSTDEVYSIA